MTGPAGDARSAGERPPRVVCISQPRFLPAANYLHRFHLSDVFVYLDTVQYTPRDWENRNRIKGPDGPQWLTVPVVRESRTQRISETRIDNSQSWAAKHRESIRKNYGKAAYFDAHFPFIDAALARDWTFLTDLNEHVTEYLNASLGFGCETVRASQLDVPGTGPALLIELVRAVSGDTYLSGPLGRDYIDAEDFSRAGIELVYHDYDAVEYPQRFGGFQPMLSAVDILFNCDDAQSRRIVRAGGLQTEHVLDRIGDE